VRAKSGGDIEISEHPDRKLFTSLFLSLPLYFRTRGLKNLDFHVEIRLFCGVTNRKLVGDVSDMDL